MRKLQPFFLLSLALAFVFSLAACSPSEKETDEQSQDNEYSHYDDVDQGEPDIEELMTADGWRKGKLRIEVDIQQGGGHDESGLFSDWTSIVKAVSEIDVMVAEDLRPYVSTPPLADINALEYEPFSLIDPDANNILSSEVTYNATWKVTTPDAKEEKQGNFTGVVDRVYLKTLKPSLYGPGYEAYLEISVSGHLKTQETLTGYGQPPITSGIDEQRTQEIVFNLHPVPNNDKLNDYEFLEEGLDEVGREAITKHKMEMLSLLNQLHQDTLPVQMESRAGMISEATEDKLTLVYQYIGTNEVGLAAMMDLNSGITKDNKIKITIELMANP